MREILFRGKRIDNGEWIKGFYCQVADESDGGTRIKQTILVPTFLCQSGFKQLEVDSETVGQFTGLTDKNGKKIFEGDIVVINTFEKGKTKKFRVEFDDGIFGIRLSANAYDSTIIPLRSFDYIEICVKRRYQDYIHDNPELLEVEK